MRVHLEDEQNLIFEEGMEANAVETAANTELNAFFIINNDENEGEGHYGVKNRPERWVKYVDMPSGKGADDTEFKGYTWTGKLWKPRLNKSDTIGRIHSVFVGSGDVYYLRILLHHTHCMGKTSFKDLRTVLDNNGKKELPTYKAVCQHLGLLQDDGEWKMALEEALARDSASAIRGLYLYILMWCFPSNPAELFKQFWDKPADKPTVGDHASRDWCDDIIRKAAKKGIVYDINNVDDKAKLKTLVLQDLQQRLLSFEKELSFFGLHTPTKEEEAAVADYTGGLSVVFREELDFDCTELRAEVEEIAKKFNPEQDTVYKKIMAAVEAHSGRCFFLKARGGCGKTFLLDAVLKAARSQGAGGRVALATATTGKAAMHLPKGRTFHSRFKAPLTPSEDCTFSIKAQSEAARLIREAELIVVDEVTMLDNYLLGGFDRLLQDIMQNELAFGGKVMVCSGDWRQTLPVIKGASRAGIVERCVNQHPLWKHFEVLELTINERVRQSGNPDLTGWDDWLLGIGDGRDGDTMVVPEEICINIGKTKKDEEKALIELVEKVFPKEMLEEEKRRQDDELARREQLAGRHARGQEEPAAREAGPERESWVKGRCILTPTNANVDEVNHFLITKWPGKEQELLSADSADEDQDRRSYSAEYLASLNPTGLPAHRLVVKAGVPLMLLRNLEPGAGLCNGTRLIFKGMRGYVMVCTIMDTNVTVLIPRISLKPKDREYPFEWSRRQYPVRVAFACTVSLHAMS